MKHFSSAFGDIFLGHPLSDLSSTVSALSGSGHFLLMDEHVARHCYPLLPQDFQQIRWISIPAGENQKTLETCTAIWEQLLRSGADRQSVFLNFGGGVITDLGGFAASCYQRGIRFVNIPTTLTGMTDAAIGGKTGVDFQYYKNYIGSFRTPEFIWVDPVFISTLPEREIQSGLAEIIKHAIIGNAVLWDYFLKVEDSGAIDWAFVLEESIPVKLNAIAEDPYDFGKRRILNFGHTIGHAIESYMLQEGQAISHGEAVSLGMMTEAWIARKAGILPEKDFDEIFYILRKWLKPAALTLPSPDILLTWMSGDKKRERNSLTFSLPDHIGSCRWNVSGLDPLPALEWLAGQVSPATIR